MNFDILNLKREASFDDKLFFVSHKPILERKKDEQNVYVDN